MRPRSRPTRPYPVLRATARLMLVIGVVLVGTAAPVARPAAASPLYGYGYVWADVASAPVGEPYEPAASYQHNSSGAVNTVTRLGTGRYAVRFPSLGAFGTALVSAYGPADGWPDTHCKIQNWRSDGTATNLNLACFTRSGTATDTRFTASYTYADSSPYPSAYLWHDRLGEPLRVAHPANPFYRFNSTGAVNTVTRDSTGEYTVLLPGVYTPSDNGGHIQVNAYGSADPDVSCHYSALGGGLPSLPIQVHCRTGAGLPADSRFTLTFVRDGNVLLAPDSHPSAYTQAYCSSSGTCAHPARWSYDTNPTADTWIERASRGQYIVHFPVPLNRGNVQVSSQSLDGQGTSNRCKIVGWSWLGVRVSCMSAMGSPVDAYISVSFVQ